MIQWHEPQLIWCLVWKGYFKKRDCVINVCLFYFPKCFLILYETKLCYWRVCNFITNKKFSCVFKGSNMQSRLTFLTKGNLKVKNDQRGKFSNLSNWKEEAWKNQGFYSTLFWFSSTNFVLWVHSQCMNCMTFYRTLGRFLSLDSQNRVRLPLEVGGRLVLSSFQLEITFFL